MQEELKRKELRWSSTYTRLRNQIDALTKENQELQDEVKVMERLRLETWKKTDTAMEKKAESSLPQLMKMEVVGQFSYKKHFYTTTTCTGHSHLLESKCYFVIGLIRCDEKGKRSHSQTDKWRQKSTSNGKEKFT